MMHQYKLAKADENSHQLRGFLLEGFEPFAVTVEKRDLLNADDSYDKIYINVIWLRKKL